MRLIALGVAAAAAFALPTAASAATECVDVTTHTAVCVDYDCNDHHCISRTYQYVYTTCDHPMPPSTCVRVYVGPK